MATVKQGRTALQATSSSNHKQQQQQQGITVAIRMRPLKEQGERRIWKVFPEHASITQLSKDVDGETGEQNPLPNPIKGKTFFTFDKTFGEDTDTLGIYNGMAKGIVNSVLEGMNGTIFAYGQTSSGKTYTMQGSGTIQDGASLGGGGIVHMAAKDIFQHVQSLEGRRDFVVKASFLEIYNEEVRDLLSNSNEALPIRQDKKRGVFVPAVERLAMDMESLLEILFEGEKSRAVASTGMNERSSRSHTIFRVSVESKSATQDAAGDKENQSDSSCGAVRVATLDLVDLAGSESVRHTGATGDRQKEGGMINQSLLTLSRVISALGQPNQTHVNFRDSKLTRLLQPKLSGNANIAIVCCATPSANYLEETRSTLQFASRAKLVKTSAKVNELHDDKAIIRRLKQELAEARRAASTGNSVPTVEMEELQAKVLDLDSEASNAKQKFERLRDLFEKTMPSIQEDQLVKTTQQRRFSAGFLSPLQAATPDKKPTRSMATMTCPRPNKRHKSENGALSPVPLNLLRDALSSKSRTIGTLQGTVNEYSRLLEEQVKTTTEASGDIDVVKEENQRLQARILHLEQLNTDMENQLRSIESVYEAGKTVSSREIRAERRQILKANSFNNKHTAQEWPTSSEITTKDIPSGCLIDMKAGETDRFCTFEFGTLEFLVAKDQAESVIDSFQKLFLPPVGWLLACPHSGCSFRCRNPSSLCSHLERRGATGGGTCSSEPCWFSHRGPHAFFLHDTVVELLKQCAQAKNVKPRDILNADAIPVAFGPAARHRWEGFRDELNFEKRLITRVASRFPSGLLEGLVEEKEAWFIQQEAKRKQQGDDQIKRPKEYPHLLTMGFLKLPKHFSSSSTNSNE